MADGTAVVGGREGRPGAALGRAGLQYPYPGDQTRQGSLMGALQPALPGPRWASPKAPAASRRRGTSALRRAPTVK